MQKKTISKDRQKYLRSIWIKKVSIVLTQIGIVIAFIAIWEISANKGLIDSFITSQPSRILQTLMNLSENKLLMHLKVTCEETLIGFSLGVAMGIVIAIILWWSDFLSKVIVTIMEILNGFLNTDKEKIKMAQTFNCSKLQLLTKIIIPANVTTFINSLKINIGLSLVGVITGEFLVSKAGLRILNSLWRSSI